MGVYRVLSWVGGVVAATLIAASQFSVDQARSNLGGWLHLVGIDRVPGFVNRPVFENVVTLVCLIYLAIMTGDLLVRWYREWRDDQS